MQAKKKIFENEIGNKGEEMMETRRFVSGSRNLCSDKYLVKVVLPYISESPQ